MSGYPFNILNHQAWKGKEQEVKKLDEFTVVVPETKIVRDFDIVTNNYLNEHESKFNSDKQAERDKSLEKLKNVRVLNTLTNKFYDPELDKNDFEKREQQHKFKMEHKTKM